MGRFYAQFARNNLKQLEMTYAGEVANVNTELITSALLQGLLSETGHDSVNLVNARLMAQEYGLVVSEVRTTQPQEGFSGLISLCTQTATHEHMLSGTIMRGQPYIVRLENYWLDFVPQGHLLVDEHDDQPGLVGKIGSVLGQAGINISFVQLGRQAKGGHAVMVLGVDEPLQQAVMEEIRALPSIRSAQMISL